MIVMGGGGGGVSVAGGWKEEAAKEEKVEALEVVQLPFLPPEARKRPQTAPRGLKRISRFAVSVALPSFQAPTSQFPSKEKEVEVGATGGREGHPGIFSYFITPWVVVEGAIAPGGGKVGEFFPFLPPPTPNLLKMDLLLLLPLPLLLSAPGAKPSFAGELAARLWL